MKINKLLKQLIQGKRNWLAYYTRFLTLGKEVLAQFIVDNCPMRAAALAFTSLLSLVPLITVSFTVMTILPFFKQFSMQLQNFIFENFVAASAQIIQAHLLKFAAQAMHLSTTGMISLVVAAVLMIFNMEQAFNAIWHVKRSRKGIIAFLLYWAILTFLPILIGLGIAISSYFFSLPFIVGTTEILGVRAPILTYFPYVLTFIAFIVLYIILPNCKVSLRSAVVGGAVATFLFELAKYGFGVFVSYFPTYTLLYGALAIIPIFLIWVYLSWLIILFGAVVSHVFGKSHGNILLEHAQAM